MKLILISSPDNIENETQLLTDFFHNGLEILHLRKPSFINDDYRNYLKRVPEKYHSRIMLHGGHPLKDEFNIRGIHYSEKKRPIVINKVSGIIQSTSFHQLQQLETANPILDYAFISPVFDSISKSGYQKAFEINKLQHAINKAPIPIVALGGITPGRIPELKSIGVMGVAVLGAIWMSDTPIKAFLAMSDACNQ
ncbi:thiamine phosphate synthase [Limibacter armeniacum]|uniref:thiamine phosphate synthase n=1 Tax=Limibacter armeniacum TaxID=466084 RepID=UPI002FE6590D